MPYLVAQWHTRKARPLRSSGPADAGHASEQGETRYGRVCAQEDEKRERLHAHRTIAASTVNYTGTPSTYAVGVLSASGTTYGVFVNKAVGTTYYVAGVPGSW
jgi:hypothetical protein